MTAGGASTGNVDATSIAAWRARLQQLLAVDDIDGALSAGLMRFPVPGGAGDAGADATGRAGTPGLPASCAIAGAQARLLEAWAARGRHRARAARLARREGLRARRRRAQALPAAPARAPDITDAQAAGGPHDAAPLAPAAGPAAAVTTLPPAAAAALARALARAATRR